MKPLFVLLTTFVLALIAITFINNNRGLSLAACIAMTAMLLFTSIGHFAFSKGMTMMMPAFIPFKKEIVYATGIFEMIAAVALLLPAWRHAAATGLLLFFVLIVPANINAAIKKVNYQKANYEGSGINYLWLRIPLQILFIAWVYLLIYRS
jgi:uncharacterized membrane protein